jgi:LacI family transcriptional regulator
MKNNSDSESFGIKEIAKKANVSIATVDRVIHNRTGVSEATKKKIQAIIKEFNYEPNIFARRLASRKILRFATLIPMVSSETDFWAAPLNGIQQAEKVVKRYGIKVDKYFFDLNNQDSFAEKAGLILKTNYDGILLAPSFIDESTKFSESCDELKIPYVFINSDIPDKQSLCYIGPDLFHSGYLGAQLVNYLIKDNDEVLVINISKGINNQHHLLRKEEGFRAYFNDNKKKNTIIKADISETDYTSVKEKLSEVLKEHQVKAIFVTNSRVFYVAQFLEEARINDIILVGYDFIQKNIEYLENNRIDFLICQRPQEQGYRGIMELYNTLVHSAVGDKIYFMPIDIITKENYKFYRN